MPVGTVETLDRRWTLLRPDPLASNCVTNYATRMSYMWGANSRLQKHPILAFCWIFSFDLLSFRQFLPREQDHERV